MRVKIFTGLKDSLEKDINKWFGEINDKNIIINEILFCSGLHEFMTQIYYDDFLEVNNGKT